MHCGVMVTGYNQGDWDRLMKGDYDRPPTVLDAENMDNTLYLGDLVEPLGFDLGDRTLWFRLFDVLATSKSGTLSLRRDQGDMAVL